MPGTREDESLDQPTAVHRKGGRAPVLQSFVQIDNLDTEPMAGVVGIEGAPELGERIGRFVILGTLGRGGMGIVVAAHDPELDRRVAIKLVHPDLWRTASQRARELLRGEARAMARLVHPNVVAVHDLGMVGDQLFVAMELVEGASLDVWRRAAPRTWREILSMCVQAGRGVAAAHQARLVHRDIKPQNVLIDRTGHARITDFGLAALIHGDRGDMTASGPSGTPAYMSPEQHFNGEVGPASDQFNFCVMVYEALFGARPFEGVTPAAVAAAVMSGKICDEPRGSPVPRRIRRALRRGLSIDPVMRFPSMDALLAALEVAPRWRRLAIVPAVGVAALVGALLARSDAGDPDVTALRLATDDAAAIWSPRRRDAVEASFAATGVAHAASSTRLVEDELDAYLQRWTLARVEVAARNRAGQDPVELGRRRAACLDRRLGDVAALVEVLATADRTVVAHAVEASRGLTPVAVCLDRIAPDDVAPDEPARRRRHHEVQAELQRAVARHQAGKDVTAELEAVVTAARVLDHPPLTAEALYQLGLVQAQREDYRGAELTLGEAIEAAARGGADRTAAQAWITWINIAANSGRAEVARERAFAARMAVERSGGDDPLRLALLNGLATEASEDGRLDDAVARSREALALAMASTSDPLKLAPALVSVGRTLAARHRHVEGLPFLQTALVLVEGQLGPTHPDLATYLDHLVAIHHELGQRALATAMAERAVAVAEPGVVTPRIVLAATLEVDDAARAEALSREVAESPDASPSARFSGLLNLAVLQYARTDFAGSAVTLDRLLALGETFYDPRLAHATALRGIVAIQTDQDGAATWCGTADGIVVDRFGRDDPSRALPLVCLAKAARLDGDIAGAVSAATEARRVAELGSSYEDQINTRHELALALWEHGDRVAARAMLSEAIARTSGVHRDRLNDILKSWQ